MHRDALVIAGVLCGLIAMVGGCLLVPLEGGKALLVAGAGDYDEAMPLEPFVMSKYNGYRMGKRAVASGRELVPLEENQEYDIDKAYKVVEILPDRVDEYMADDAKLLLGESPIVMVTIEEVMVIKRIGAGGVVLPKVEVSARVTLSDGANGTILGVAQVSGATGSRILADARQMANIIGRGTAKWINDNQKLD